MRNGGVVARFKANREAHLQYENQFKTVYFLDVFSIFLILVTGLIFSIVILIFEIYNHKNIRKISIENSPSPTPNDGAESLIIDERKNKIILNHLKSK